MAYETILFDIANGAAKITLNRPDRLNSFTVQMHSEVADALSKVESDASIRAFPPTISPPSPPARWSSRTAR